MKISEEILQLIYVIIVSIGIMLIASITKANAFNSYSSIGITNLYTKIDDPKFDFVNEYEQFENPKQNINSINFSHCLENKSKWSACLSTNRLFNKDTSHTIRSKATGTEYLLKSKLRYDSLQVGKRLKERYLISPFIANVNLKKGVYYNNKLVSKNDNTSFIYGINFTTFLNKDFSLNSILIAPNEELYMKWGLGIGFNYIIKL